MTVRALALVALLCCFAAAPASADDKPSPYYEETVAASNPLRVEQAQELDRYIETLRKDESRLATMAKPDYSSPAVYEKSTEALRKAFCDSIGYPPPGAAPKDNATFDKIGEDDIGVYYRAKIPVLPEVHAEGIYIVPKHLTGRAPLVISMHGGGGSPEVALFHGGTNYHDMVRGGVKQGYVIFAPQHLFNADGYPKDIRNQIDTRMRLVGTSLTAVEVAKITRSLDVLVKRPEVDAERIGMVGLSYGGYYTLVTPAIETRIKASVSSCYFGVQEFRYEKDELAVPSDFQFKDRFTLFRDTQLVALICPRALEIQAGDKDDPAHREAGRLLIPVAETPYVKLGLQNQFRYVLFSGGHEFHDESAWEFLKKHL